MGQHPQDTAFCSTLSHLQEILESPTHDQAGTTHGTAFGTQSNEGRSKFGTTQTTTRNAATITTRDQPSHEHASGRSSGSFASYECCSSCGYPGSGACCGQSDSSGDTWQNDASQSKRKSDTMEGQGQGVRDVVKRVKFENNITLRTISQSKKNRKNYHPLIPEIPFFWVILGGSGTGKSHVVANLLKMKRGYHGKFDRVFVVNPHFSIDKIYKDLGLNESRIFDGEDALDEIEKLFRQKEQWVKTWDDWNELSEEEQLTTPKPLPPTNDLVVLDDTFGTDFTGPFKNGPVEKFSTYGRKLKMSCILVAHKLRGQVSPIIRKNKTHMSAFAFRNSDEYQTFVREECPPQVPKKTFEKIYGECTKDPHSFLHIDYSRPEAVRFSKCFEEIFVV